MASGTRRTFGARSRIGVGPAPYLPAVDLPSLPPVPPGRSALPAFLGLESWVAEERGGVRTEALRALEQARAEAERLRAAGEGRLEALVLEAEQEAVRTAEDGARDRVSAARTTVSRWVDAAENGIGPVVEEAVQRLVGG